MVRYNLSVVGAGRVAGALCRKLYFSGHKIIRISSLSYGKGRALALECAANWSSDLSFPEPADIIIVAVPDHRLEEVLREIKCSPETLVVHTAGSFGLEVFPENIRNRGVFYPLQTFTEGRMPDFKDLPFLIESAVNESLLILEKLALSLDGIPYDIDVDKRKRLHLAAVFVCNFTNHLLTIGKEISSESGLPFSVLEPLVRETICKALDNGPENSQTGPAVRNDQNTIKKHLDLLSFSPDLKELYEFMTKSIIEHYKNMTNG